MAEIKQAKIAELEASHKHEHPDFEYYRKKFLPFGSARQCVMSVYEVPPGKAAYPYHYHSMNEEVFYIISGEGNLRTPEGVRKVSAGELLFFPAEENGAHQLINASETELLVYLDFDTANEIDTAVYPDSGKIGIWGKGINKVFRLAEETDYYEGE